MNPVRFGKLDPISMVGLGAYDRLIREDARHYRAHLEGQLRLLGNAEERDRVDQTVQAILLDKEFGDVVHDTRRQPNAFVEKGWVGKGYMGASTRIQSTVRDLLKSLSLAGAVNALRQLDELPQELPIHATNALQDRINRLVEEQGDGDLYVRLRAEEAAPLHEERETARACRKN